MTTSRNTLATCNARRGSSITHFSRSASCSAVSSMSSAVSDAVAASFKTIRSSEVAPGESPSKSSLVASMRRLWSSDQRLQTALMDGAGASLSTVVSSVV